MASTPGIFKWEMEKLLKGIKVVVVFIDDILIAWESDKANLRVYGGGVEVVNRGCQLAAEAEENWCQFWRAALISWGIELMPKDSTHLRRRSRLSRMPLQPPLSWSLTLGVPYPVYKLLLKSSLWKWGCTQCKASEESKLLLTSDKLLIHFDPNLRLSLSCDASAYGLGVVLSHKMPMETNNPSPMLPALSECNYSQN